MTQLGRTSELVVSTEAVIKKLLNTPVEVWVPTTPMETRKKLVAPILDVITTTVWVAGAQHLRSEGKLCNRCSDQVLLLISTSSGIFPTEPGRDDVRRDRDDTSGSSKQDSTAGKLMEKAGGMFKSNKLQERGEQKRREAGGYDDSSNY